MILPWVCVTALKLAPVGPIDPQVFGLRPVCHLCGSGFAVVAPFRETLENGFCATCGGGWIGPTEGAQYAIVDRQRVTFLRDTLGCLVHDPRTPRPAKSHPWYLALTSIHRGLTEGGKDV